MPRKRSGKNLGVQVGLRATDEAQRDRWQRAAELDGMPFSVAARRALDAWARRVIERVERAR